MLPCYLPDDTIGALSQFLGHSVPLIHNELLVKDLEHLAALKIAHVGHARASDEIREGKS